MTPFPVDAQTLDLLDRAINPGPDAERSSLGEFCQLVADMNGADGQSTYHHNDVIAALVAEVRRLRAEVQP